jgi:hypothetical protein
MAGIINSPQYRSLADTANQWDFITPSDINQASSDIRASTLSTKSPDKLATVGLAAGIASGAGQFLGSIAQGVFGLFTNRETQAQNQKQLDFEKTQLDFQKQVFDRTYQSYTNLGLPFGGGQNYSFKGLRAGGIQSGFGNGRGIYAV